MGTGAGSSQDLLTKGLGILIHFQIEQGFCAASSGRAWKQARESSAALLATEGDIEIAGQAQNGREMLDLVLTVPPGVLLTDVEMPELTGLEPAAEIKRRRLPVRVVILTTFARAGYLRRALDAGVSGYLSVQGKDAPASTLANAIRSIRAVAAGPVPIKHFRHFLSISLDFGPSLCHF